MAVAVGSPSGFESTVTSGVISGTGREIPAEYTGGMQDNSLVDLIQTDAPISPGNSGGALVNDQGQVVGISEAYIPPSQGAVSIGFAIPSATVIDIVGQLLRAGRARHAYLGIQPADVTPDVAQELGLRSASGALLLDVASGGPAARAGLQRGDVIVAFAGQPVNTPEDLLALLRKQGPGDKVQLAVVRSGRQQKVQVTLSDRPAG